MFNYFKNGITDAVPEMTINIEILENLIKNNHHKDAIQHLRQLLYGSEEYKKTKTGFPYITPHGTFKDSRKNKNFEKFSGFLYYDIDSTEIKEDLTDFKKKLIEKYRDAIAMLGISIGGKGLFFYVHIENSILVNKDNFETVYNYIKNQYFKDIPTDDNAKGIARAHFIPSDPALFVNHNSIIEIPESILNSNYSVNDRNNNCNNDFIKKDISRYINNDSKGYICNYTFLPITEVMSKLRFETPVDVKGELYDINPIDFVKLFVPRKIKDGKKHQTFIAQTNVLIYLNPEADCHTIQSYINYVNQNYTDGRPMKTTEMLNTVKYVYDNAKQSGVVLVRPKMKRIHFRKDCNISGDEKRALAAKLNGQIKKQISIEKIISSITNLQGKGKITRAQVAKNSQLGICTVKKYWKEAAGKC